jgi:molybdopterin molybdotransferase
MKTSWRDVLRDCLALAKPYGTERVERRMAGNRVLAEDVLSDRDYPGGDLSMMDGYAVGAKTRESYRVEGENTPGAGAGAPLAAETARRIFTGAELPANATRIVPQENVRRDGDTISISDWPDTDFVRPRGREAKQGDVVLAKGTKIGPVELAVLATLGCLEVEVVKYPLVARLATGDEVASPDEPLPEGKIRDSNGDLIEGFLRPLPVHAWGRCGDDRGTVFAFVETMVKDWDFLLISGGASVGDHDHARPALEAAGFTFLAHGLHVRPGRPVGIARRGEQWAFALPGNPLSHLIVLRLLVVPILRACCGELDVEPQLIRAILEAELNREVPKRDTFWPATITLRDGQFHARPGRFLSSGDLIGTAGINGFVHLPMGQPVPAPGGDIDILPLSPMFP